jgi:predicted nucleotidyltransferase
VNREEVIQRLKEVKPLLREEFGVVKIGLFGSVARGESSKESDIDILIEKEKPLSLIRFMRMKLLLEKRLGKKVDLISLEGLREELREEVEKEVIYV